MPETVSGDEFFHVTRILTYNNNPPLEIGQQFEVGNIHNPFFGFYENEIKYTVSDPSGQIKVKAIKFLSLVKDGKINCPTLPKTAHEIAEHYIMLVRELIMEEVRKEVAPDAPSRKSCLWVVENIDQARHWVGRLGGNSRIARLSMDGTIHRADANLMLGDSEPLSRTYANAHSYWQGEMSDSPEPEVIFSGTTTVVAFED